MVIGSVKLDQINDARRRLNACALPLDYSPITCRKATSVKFAHEPEEGVYVVDVATEPTVLRSSIPDLEDDLSNLVTDSLSIVS